MNNIQKAKYELKVSKASLVVIFENGTTKSYFGKRTDDLKTIIWQDKNALKNATIADKVIGKVASSLMCVSGVYEVYAEVLSQSAKEVFDEYNVPVSYGTLVEYIINNDKTDMCPMEKKYKNEKDIEKIYNEILSQKK